MNGTPWSHGGRTRLACLLLVGVLVFVATATRAQPRESARRQRARTFLVVHIAEALKLNEQEALKVSQVVRESDQRREQLMRERQTLETQLHKALDRKAADSELAPLVAAANDLDQKIAMVPEDTFSQLQKTLTVEQQARLVLFRRELQAEVRRAMQHRLRGAHRTPPKAGSAPTPTPAH
ncbi:MAG: hypothetical protein HY270_10125 [Deltaproteobacteria bacterium]|nr:hypothetical protein [Deltaproteobacteria bacterium]